MTRCKICRLERYVEVLQSIYQPDMFICLPVNMRTTTDIHVYKFFHIQTLQNIRLYEEHNMDQLQADQVFGGVNDCKISNIQDQTMPLQTVFKYQTVGKCRWRDF
ncbi:Hypothetical_protein [Hexamita inflata]|uniref:Hypothetical_protein n=1 Tax=Hexamita inflata TaxID=28002 RepID=A0AA86PU51_9EUKA|nr:Hypothetical protein HINF_LOCUS31268 [Hexamita inflata]